MKNILFCCCLFFLSLEVTAQTMYALLIVQDAASVGTYKDKETMLHLWNEIDTKVRELEVVVISIDALDATEDRIQAEINKLPITTDDVLWLYYTGHGSNYDTWPMMDETELPLSKVQYLLKQSGARLTLAMYDSCSWRDPIAPSPEEEIGWVKSAPNYYKFLFLYSKGHIKMASCSSKQFSYGSESSGSFFTNAFQDAIKGKASWKDVLQECKQLTESLATANQRVQNPKYKLSPSFKDGSHF